MQSTDLRLTVTSGLCQAERVGRDRDRLTRVFLNAKVGSLGKSALSICGMVH
ncbi:MAG: hypothetical protein U0R50_08740 [Gaiellales bacterium]